MADLENLLLEAAGRTNAAGKNRQSFSASRRRREGSYSDHGSDSRDDESDDGRGGYSSRKPSGAQVPLKKRFESADRDENQGGGEGDDDYARSDGRGSSDESDVGSDLYKDEDDRRKLAEMTELEREMILLDRATKKDDKEFKDKLRLKRENDKASSASQSRKQTPPLSSARVRMSARSADRAAAKDDALNELRAKRLKQQDPEAHRRLRDASSSRGGVKDFSPVKRKAFSTGAAAAAVAPVSHSSQSDSESRSDSEDDVSAADVDSDEDGGPMGSSEKKLKFEDIKEISIRRSKLSKWLMEPFFEELIVGCFVRVGIGMSKSKQSIYRLCMVRNVDASDPDRQYKLENKMTYKYLNVVWGNESSAARWQMAMVSDSPPLEEEFNQWVREVERTGGRMPSKHEVLEKKEAIKKINSFVYSAATVKQMLKDKKSATTRPLNIAAEKDRLRKELEVAEYKQNEGEVERIKRRIQELDASRNKSQMKDSKAIKLAEMNRKNRVENFKNASDNKAVNTGLKAGEAGYDPFSRRWTRSRNYYVSKPPSKNNNTGEEGEESAAMEVAGGGGGLVNNNAAAAAAAATAKALEEAADAGKLIDTRAPVDEMGMESNQFHNFELPISLNALHKFGGSHGALAGFMARKQKIEATIGCRVAENDGRRHVLTLTVSDYKRRRGLL